MNIMNYISNFAGRFTCSMQSACDNVLPWCSSWVEPCQTPSFPWRTWPIVNSSHAGIWGTWTGWEYEQVLYIYIYIVPLLKPFTARVRKEETLFFPPDFQAFWDLKLNSLTNDHDFDLSGFKCGFTLSVPSFKLQWFELKPLFALERFQKPNWAASTGTLEKQQRTL